MSSSSVRRATRILCPLSVLALCVTLWLSPPGVHVLRTSFDSVDSDNGAGKTSGVRSIAPRVFQIALGPDYYRRVNWAVVKRNLLEKLPAGFTYELYTDLACQDFLQRFFPEHMLLFERLQHPAWKADLVRYLLLYKYGGLYIDIDLQLLVPLADIFARTDAARLFTVGARLIEPLEAVNGLIATPAGDLLFLRLVDGLYKDEGVADYGVNVKRFYAELALAYPGLHDFTRVKDAFFMREMQVKDAGPKYVIRMDSETVAVLSNGHGYPPRVSRRLMQS
jgi:hypothetical protein